MTPHLTPGLDMHGIRTFLPDSVLIHGPSGHGQNVICVDVYNKQQSVVNCHLVGPNLYDLSTDITIPCDRFTSIAHTPQIGAGNASRAGAENAENMNDGKNERYDARIAPRTICYACQRPIRPGREQATIRGEVICSSPRCAGVRHV